MKFISKTMLIKVALSVMIGACLAMGVSLFLPAPSFDFVIKNETQTQSTFKVSEAFGLKTKQRKKEEIQAQEAAAAIAAAKIAQKQKSREFLLKDFAINGIYLDNKKNSMVIVKDARSGTFLHVGDVHQGYELDEVFMKKARFKKGLDFFWSFLDPLDEQEFTGVDTFEPRKSVAIERAVDEEIDLFVDVVFKHGKYFVPKNMLSDKADMMKHLNTAGSKMHNTSDSISFEISYLPKSSVFYKLGLRKGDIIVGANGSNFVSIKDPVDFFQTIDSVKDLSISVKRDNELKEFLYEVY